eukprot:1195542-Prorocentrum_minimum.AAC.7
MCEAALQVSRPEESTTPGERRIDISGTAAQVHPENPRNIPGAPGALSVAPGTLAQHTQVALKPERHPAHPAH